jgi:hypothetical protein
MAQGTGAEQSRSKLSAQHLHNSLAENRRLMIRRLPCVKGQQHI